MMLGVGTYGHNAEGNFPYQFGFKQNRRHNHIHPMSVKIRREQRESEGRGSKGKEQSGWAKRGSARM